MNDQGRQSDESNHTEAEPIQATVSGDHPDKPKPQFSDSEAQALLSISNLQTDRHPKTKLPLSLLITIAALVVIVIAASYALSALKHGTRANTANSSNSLGLPNQSVPSSGKGVSNQINQDVKSCSNPVNASLVC